MARKPVKLKRETIFDTEVGWLTPAGTVLSSARFHHVEMITQWDECPPEVVAKWEECKTNIEEAEAGCRALSDEGEHPEWHTFEMAQDEQRWEFTTFLYDRGFIRLALERNLGILEAEGRRMHLVGRHPELLRLTEQFTAHCGREIRLRTNPR